MKVFLLNPFSFKSVGLKDKAQLMHNVPHKSFLEYLRSKNFIAEHHYLEDSLFRRGNFSDRKEKKFIVNFNFNRDYLKFKKQYSTSYLKYISKENPDIIIINMSAHASKFCHDVARSQLERGKKYICMLGGQHYSDTRENLKYYQKADMIIVHTSLQRRKMLNLNQFKGKTILVMPLGIDCSKYNESFNLSNRVAYTGRIVELKRIHLAINAISYCKTMGLDVKLDIYGPISSFNYMQRLKDLIKSKELFDNVRFQGTVENRELNKLYQDYSVFLLPSYKETFGMVMIEAMASGLPVLAIDDDGGPMDVIHDGEDGFLTDKESYNKLLFQVLSNKEKLKVVKHNAFLRIQNEFDLNTINQNLFKALKLDVNN